MHRTIGYLDDPANARRYTTARWQTKDVLGEFDNAGEQCGATCEDHPSFGTLGIATLLDLLEDHLEDLLHARFNDVAEVYAREPLRFTLTQAAYIEDFVQPRHGTIGTPIGLFEAFGLWKRRVQAIGQIIGDMLPTDPEDGRMLDAMA